MSITNYNADNVGLVPASNRSMSVHGKHGAVNLPSQISFAHRRIVHYREILEERGNRFFDGLFTSSQQAQAWELSTPLSQSLDALSSYLIHRVQICENYKAVLEAKFQVRSEYEDLVREFLATQTGLHSLPPEPLSIYQTIDELGNMVTLLDSRACGLADTYNNAVDELKIYIYRHRFAFSKKTHGQLPVRIDYGV